MTDLDVAKLFQPHVDALVAHIDAQGDELHDRLNDALWESSDLAVRAAWRDVPGSQQTRVLDYLLAC